MTYADFDFYQNEYKGILIENSSEYAYFAERAGDELASFANRISNEDEEAQTALKRCSCRITDILWADFKQSKNGLAKINSESVSSYYSVSYSTPDNAQIRRMINTSITLYLGKYILGARPVVV